MENLLNFLNVCYETVIKVFMLLSLAFIIHHLFVFKHQCDASFGLMYKEQYFEFNFYGECVIVKLIIIIILWTTLFLQFIVNNYWQSLYLFLELFQIQSAFQIYFLDQVDLDFQNNNSCINNYRLSHLYKRKTFPNLLFYCYNH